MPRVPEAEILLEKPIYEGRSTSSVTRNGLGASLFCGLCYRAFVDQILISADAMHI